MSRLVQIMPTSTILQNNVGVFEVRVKNYKKIVGVLPAAATFMNFALSINDGVEVLIGGFLVDVLGCIPDKRVLHVEKEVNDNDLIRISLRQSLIRDGLGYSFMGKIYLVVE